MAETEQAGPNKFKEAELVMALFAIIRRNCPKGSDAMNVLTSLIGIVTDTTTDMYDKDKTETVCITMGHNGWRKILVTTESITEEVAKAFIEAETLKAGDGYEEVMMKDSLPKN